MIYTMIELLTFENPQMGTIRTTVDETGEPLFCAKDVAVALEYKDPSRAVRDHCKGAGVLHTPTAGGVQPMKYIKEADLYRLVLHSRNPMAEQFQDWICEEVLPAIRKTGKYFVSDAPKKQEDSEDMLLAKAVLISQDKIEKQKSEISQLQNKIERDKTKVLVADTLEDTEGTILIGDLAHLLSQKGVPAMGQKRLFKWLRENGYLSKENKPMQKWLDAGIFKQIERTVKTSSGDMQTFTTKVTGKGQRYFICYFLSPTLVLMP